MRLRKQVHYSYNNEFTQQKLIATFSYINIEEVERF